MTQTFKMFQGDVIIDVRTGRPTLIADKDKLSQDLGENLNIETQPNGFGASLDSMVGLVGDPLALRAELSRRVRTSVRAMQTLQQRYHRGARPANERIADIANISVAQVVGKDTTDALPPSGLTGNITPTDLTTGQVSKTAFGFKVDVLTEAGAEPVSAGALIIGSG